MLKKYKTNSSRNSIHSESKMPCSNKAKKLKRKKTRKWLPNSNFLRV